MAGANEQIGRDISNLLFDVWGIWLKKLGEGNEEIPAELLVSTINICGGHIASKDTLSHSEYRKLSVLTNKICHQLREFRNANGKLMVLESRKKQSRNTVGEEIEKGMQLLVQMVLQDSTNGISKDIKETFLVVAKTFYHRAFFPDEEIENHISMILFERLV